jgi:serine/threonine protein phosphatase PrpC
MEAELCTLESVGSDCAFLLCSDGFWEYVKESEMICDLLKSETANNWLSYMLCRLGERVPKLHDNLSAIAIIVKE